MSSTFAQADTRRRTTWNSATERLAGIVAAAYRSCKEAPVLAASTLDPTFATYGTPNDAPDTPSRSKRWTPATAEYIVDVELGVRRALELKPESERAVLLDAWWRFLLDDTKVDAVQRRVIGILAPAFYRRELHPGQYFKRSVR